MFEVLEKIKEMNPLVHNITNIVVARDSANGLLAIGASPIMASAKEEVSELATIADVLVINIGTLDEELVIAMKLAGKAANQAKTPVILDPVGVGATQFRKKVVAELLAEIKFTAIRGNAGELAAILGVPWHAQGVDAGSGEVEVKEIAAKVAKKYETIVVISGKVDVISDSERFIEVANGSSLLPQITGSGCLLSAVCGAFIATNVLAPLEACVAACASYAVASEFAEQRLARKLPGSFQAAFLDELSNWDKVKILENAAIHTGRYLK